MAVGLALDGMVAARAHIVGCFRFAGGTASNSAHCVTRLSGGRREGSILRWQRPSVRARPRRFFPHRLSWHPLSILLPVLVIRAVIVAVTLTLPLA